MSAASTTQNFSAEIDARSALDVNEKPRLLFNGILWREHDLQCCIHGEKLRWACDECEQFFSANTDKLP